MQLFMVPNEPLWGKLNATSTHEIHTKVKKKKPNKHQSTQVRIPFDY